LGDYPKKLVEYAADPRTGVISKFPMGLPNIGQIKTYLDETQSNQVRLERYSTLPVFKPFKPAPIVRRPNLFVPDDNRRYDEMLRRRDFDRENRSEFGQHNGKNGIWVPLSWWETREKPNAA
jgi:hypothetical protein